MISDGVQLRTKDDTGDVDELNERAKENMAKQMTKLRTKNITKLTDVTSGLADLKVGYLFMSLYVWEQPETQKRTRKALLLFK